MARRRAIRTLLVSLAVGTAASLAVAITAPFVLHKPVQVERVSITSEIRTTTMWRTVYRRHISGDTPVSVPADPAAERDALRALPYAGQQAAAVIFQPAEFNLWWSCDLWGFPMRSLWGWWAEDAAGQRSERAGLITVHAADAAKRPNADPRRPTYIPYWPLWPGLVANAVIFSAACWLVGVGGRRALALLRRRRGGCPVCGYDLRGLGPGAPCPECGGPRLTPDHS